MIETRENFACEAHLKDGTDYPRLALLPRGWSRVVTMYSTTLRLLAVKVADGQSNELGRLDGFGEFKDNRLGVGIVNDCSDANIDAGAAADVYAAEVDLRGRFGVNDDSVGSFDGSQEDVDPSGERDRLFAGDR